MGLSCSQCDHEFEEQEEYQVLISGRCSACGSELGLADQHEQHLDQGNTPFSYDPNQDFKTEQ